ncbi:MAG: M24 family metallopeptidase [Gemmatimonadota bacterium]
MRARLPDGFVEATAAELERRSLDGWLLFDLEGRNRVTCELLGLGDGPSRRIFLLLRPGAKPSALAHRIELDAWDGWEGDLEAYVGWKEMEEALGRMLGGCEVVAMEVSRRDDVPFVDQVPAGVVELIESLDVRVVSSASLITGTYAQWGDSGYEAHVRAGALLADIAEAAFERGLEAVREGACLTEHDLAEWILARIAAAGLADGAKAESGLAEGGTIVAAGPNSASAHYEPVAGSSAVLEAGQVLLIDLWGKVAGDPDAVFADQTWMGVLGDEGPPGFQEAWNAVRAARDGAVELIRSRSADGALLGGTEVPLLTGAEVDREARRILEEAGFGEHIQHRLGHGMDRALHGFGPNLDSVETRDERELVPGIGFSVEPGVYLSGRFGVRSEINVYLRADGPEVTTPRPQMEPWPHGRAGSR